MKGIGMRFLASIVLCAFTAVVQASDSFSLGEAGNLERNGKLAFNIEPVEEDQPCDGFTSGDIGMNAEGLILSCQSGVWATPNPRLDIALSTCRGSNFVGCNPGCPSSHPNVVASQHSWPLYMMIAGINICGR